MASQWYQHHLGEGAKVMLLTNDMDNRRKAREDGIVAETGTSFLLTVLFDISAFHFTDMMGRVSQILELIRFLTLRFFEEFRGKLEA